MISVDMAEAVSPQPQERKRSLSLEDSEKVVKKSKADSPNATLNSSNLQSEFSSIINQLNEDRESDQVIMDGEYHDCCGL